MKTPIKWMIWGGFPLFLVQHPIVQWNHRLLHQWNHSDAPIPVHRICWGQYRCPTWFRCNNGCQWNSKRFHPEASRLNEHLDTKGQPQKISTTKCQEKHEPYNTAGYRYLPGHLFTFHLQFQKRLNTESGFHGTSTYLKLFSQVSPASSSFLGCTWSSWPTLGSSAILRRSFLAFLANSYLRIGWLKTWQTSGGLNFQIQGCNSLGWDIV